MSTFEVTPGALRPLASAVTLAEASGMLPAGAYTSFRTYRGRRVARLDHHLQRLHESIAIERTSPAPAVAPLDRAAVRHAIAEVLRLTGHAESRLRLTFAPPRLFISIEPFVPMPESVYREGIRCLTVPVRRQAPHAKDTRFIGTADDTYRHLPAGVHEGLLVGEDGAVLEGLSSNFFAVHEGVLRTEEERALAGVTRSLVLEAAEGVLPIRLEAVHLAELDRVPECFITSASRGLLPVAWIDERIIGDARPGPVTLTLKRRFEEQIEREAEEVT